MSKRIYWIMANIKFGNNSVFGGFFMARKTSRKGASSFPGIFGAVLSAAAFTIFSILVLAVLLRYGVVSEEIIPIFNQAVKVVSICIAAFLSVRQVSQNPWFRGLFSGLLYMILGFVVFSIISKTLSLSISLLFDVVMAIVLGAIVGTVFAKRANKSEKNS